MSETEKETLAQRLSRLREFACLTQDELAKKAEVSGVTISRIENGASASPAVARKLAKALGVEPGWFRTGRKKA